MFDSTVRKIDLELYDFVNLILAETRVESKVIYIWIYKSELNKKIESGNQF